jgi:hypothetical protein
MESRTEVNEKTVISTSSLSEQVFLTTGFIINAKRTMLSPENVGKIQVIHDNYNFVEKGLSSFLLLHSSML